jgi:hypothetical protein
MGTLSIPAGYALTGVFGVSARFEPIRHMGDGV